MGKKLVAARALPAGHVLAEGDLVAKSPADEGLPPYELDEVRRAGLVRDLAEDETLLADDVAPADARRRRGDVGSGRAVHDAPHIRAPRRLAYRAHASSSGSSVAVCPG